MKSQRRKNEVKNSQKSHKYCIFANKNEINVCKNETYIFFNASKPNSKEENSWIASLISDCMVRIST